MFGNLMNLPLCVKNVTRSAGLFGNVMCNKKLDVSKQILSASGLHISAGNMTKGVRESTVDRKMEMEYTSPHVGQFTGYILSHLPHPTLPEQLFQNVPFKEIPIVSVKVSKNNTIFSLSNHLGHVKLILSCGIEGYKNAKKGTNIAAQATGINFARRAVDMGFKTVRLQIKGLGPSRTSSVKGLISGGLEIISVTDNTPVSDQYPRPKKLRRI